LKPETGDLKAETGTGVGRGGRSWVVVATKAEGEKTKRRGDKEDRPRMGRMNGEDFIFRRVTPAENHGSERGKKGGKRGMKLET
jgi:hypothetical protein